MPAIELIYDDDCPNVAEARDNLRQALASLEMSPHWQEWSRDDDASPPHVRRYGSPTILVEERDVAWGDAPAGGSCCRLYAQSDGSMRGAPSVDTITAALARVTATMESRRSFLVGAGASTALLFSGCGGQSGSAPPAQSPAGGRGEGEVSVNEDLMREHGVLRRLLLIYEASRALLAMDAGFQAAPLYRAAGLVQRFIEQYHEKLEEDHLFPRFERAGRLVALVTTLREQHLAGRRVTEAILEQTGQGEASADAEGLTRAIDSFLRMYRPHAAREDTVLFPALREIVSASELVELGEQFEEIEHQRFGERGFESVVEEVAEIERDLGIHDLAQFTPRQ